MRVFKKKARGLSLKSLADQDENAWYERVEPAALDQVVVDADTHICAKCAPAFRLDLKVQRRHIKVRNLGALDVGAVAINSATTDAPEPVPTPPRTALCHICATEVSRKSTRAVRPDCIGCNPVSVARPAHTRRVQWEELLRVRRDRLDDPFTAASRLCKLCAPHFEFVWIRNEEPYIKREGDCQKCGLLPVFQTGLCRKCHRKRRLKPEDRTYTCAKCSIERTANRWYSGDAPGEHVCRRCHEKEDRTYTCAKCSIEQTANRWYSGDAPGEHVCRRCYRHKRTRESSM